MITSSAREKVTLEWRGKGVSHALHELGKKKTDNISAPVQLRGTTLPHLTKL